MTGLKTPTNLLTNLCRLSGWLCCHRQSALQTHGLCHFEFLLGVFFLTETLSFSEASIVKVFPSHSVLQQRPPLVRWTV